MALLKSSRTPLVSSLRWQAAKPQTSFSSHSQGRNRRCHEWNRAPSDYGSLRDVRSKGHNPRFFSVVVLLRCPADTSGEGTWRRTSGTKRRAGNCSPTGTPEEKKNLDWTTVVPRPECTLSRPLCDPSTRQDLSRPKPIRPDVTGMVVKVLLVEVFNESLGAIFKDSLGGQGNSFSRSTRGLILEPGIGGIPQLFVSTLPCHFLAAQILVGGSIGYGQLSPHYKAVTIQIFPKKNLEATKLTELFFFQAGPLRQVD